MYLSRLVLRAKDAVFRDIYDAHQLAALQAQPAQPHKELVQTGKGAQSLPPGCAEKSVFAS